MMAAATTDLPPRFQDIGMVVHDPKSGKRMVIRKHFCPGIGTIDVPLFELPKGLQWIPDGYTVTVNWQGHLTVRGD